MELLRALRALRALPLAALMVAGCAPGGSEAAERRADTAGRRDSIAAAAAASLSESQVLGLLAASNAADSAIGALGATRGSSQEIKEFGRMIQREHHALRQEALDLGQQLGIGADAPSVALDAPPPVQAETLGQTDAGAAWDRAYVDYALSAHESTLENISWALAAARRVEVRQFIERSVPIVQKHIDKAKLLQKVASGPRDTVMSKRDSLAALKKGAPLR